MATKKHNASRLCDICGEAYYGEQYGPYDENICNACLQSDDLPLINEDVDDSEIPLSVDDEMDGGKGDDEDDD